MNFPGLRGPAPSGFCVYSLVYSQLVYPFQWAYPQGYAKDLKESGEALMCNHIPLESEGSKAQHRMWARQWLQGQTVLG